jgi:hypothetical protein
MSRQHHPGNAEASRRALILAAGAAAGVLLLLIASIGLIWLVGQASPNAPALGAQPPPTPTPRSLMLMQVTPAPDAPEVEQPNEAPLAPTPTSALLTMPGDEQQGAPRAGILFSAPDNNPFASVAAGSWRATPGTLRNDGTTADAEPWLMLTTVPGAAFAIEAEIRVNAQLDTFCDQSFGLAGGNATAGQVYGAGILYPCEEESTRARLTDISVWEDGYHADPIIADNEFDPGNDWHTYRFELRDGTIRLIVDGVGMVTGAIDPTLTAADGGEAGVWSQGVNLEIRRVEVSPLPAS